MRIVHLVAGAGGMYCGTCLHANTLVTALRAAGHDAMLLPAYTPLRVDEEDVSHQRVVLGGINVYLQQLSPRGSALPRLIERALDHPTLLRWAGRFAAATRPASLGPLTVSMLAGEEGRQRKELDKLIAWLNQELRPDVVHLSTALLAGMGRSLQQRLGVPVVATLAGEDSFLDRLPEPYRRQAWERLGERCRELAALVALNGYYADFMSESLAIPRQQITVIPPGLNLAGHRLRPAERFGREFTIGFLARVCPDKGVHLLAEAFELLAADTSLPPLRLVVAGHLAKVDRPYWSQIQARLTAAGLAERLSYAGEPSRAEKIALLGSCDAFCLPTVYRESKGLPVLEAWANGVPVVAPEHGTFPELIADTGGGLLCRPNDARSLADCLRRLILDPQLAAELGRRGADAVRDRYHAAHMAETVGALYARVRNR